MDIFLERLNLPRLNKKEIENINRWITSIEIETMILKLATNKSPEPEGFTDKFYQPFREELILIFLKLFQKIAKEATLPSSFYEAIVTLVPKPKIPHKKENYRPISLIDIDTNIFNSILATWIQYI